MTEINNSTEKKNSKYTPVEEKFYDLTVKRLRQRGVKLSDIKDLVWLLQKDYIAGLTSAMVDDAVDSVLHKTEVQNIVLFAINCDQLAEKGMFDEPLEEILKRDEGLFQADEDLAFGVNFTAGTIAMTNFAYLDRTKPGIVGWLNDKKTGRINVFLDDVVSAIAANAASKLANNHPDLKSIYATDKYLKDNHVADTKPYTNIDGSKWNSKQMKYDDVLRRLNLTDKQKDSVIEILEENEHPTYSSDLKSAKKLVKRDHDNQEQEKLQSLIKNSNEFDYNTQLYPGMTIYTVLKSENGKLQMLENETLTLPTDADWTQWEEYMQEAGNNANRISVQDNADYYTVLDNLNPSASDNKSVLSEHEIKDMELNSASDNKRRRNIIVVYN